MEKNIELDTKILNKNLEITKALNHNTILLSQLADLKERMKAPFVINTLNTCHAIINDYKDANGVEANEDIKRDLRRVISFLLQ